MYGYYDPPHTPPPDGDDEDTEHEDPEEVTEASIGDAMQLLASPVSPNPGTASARPFNAHTAYMQPRSVEPAWQAAARRSNIRLALAARRCGGIKHEAKHEVKSEEHDAALTALPDEHACEPEDAVYADPYMTANL